MNEPTQLKAIEIELRAAGWKVTRNARPAQVGLPDSAPVLDFLGERASLQSDGGEPEFLVVEVPNRRRSWTVEYAATVDPHHFQAVADETIALARLEAISEALAAQPNRNIAFQIRFLDVSADQAQARDLRGFSPTGEAFEAELRAAGQTLMKLEAREDTERALIIAFTWCRWLRMMGERFPGRRHKELKGADLRTIQKDLYDAQIVATAPADYFVIHQSIMAVYEGGETNWRALESLKGDLWRVLEQVAAHLDVSDFSAPAPSRGRQGIEVFDRVETFLRLLGDETATPLIAQLARLRETDGTPPYRQALIDFEELVPPDDPRINSLLPELRQLTRHIRQ